MEEVRDFNRARLALLALLVTAPPWGAQVTGGQQSDLSNLAVGGTLDYIKLAVVAGAAWLAYLARPKQPIPAPVWLLLAFAATGMLGAALTGDQSGILRAGRLAVVIIATTWAVARLGLAAALRCIAVIALAMTAAAVLAVGLGLQPLIGGRLAGYLPALQPNVFAAVAVGGLLSLFALWAEKQLTTGRFAASGLILLAAVVLTGSRTALGALAAAILVLLIRSISRGAWRVALLAYAAILSGLAALWFAWDRTMGLVADLLTRAGQAGIDPTFTGRSTAWQAAALFNHTQLQKLFGQGLQFKALRVPRGPTHIIQGIDSSWWSAYVGAGYVGVVLLAAALLWAVAAAARAREVGSLTLLVALVVSSFTESSLADVSFGMVLVVVAAAGIRVRATTTPPAVPVTVGQPVRQSSNVQLLSRPMRIEQRGELFWALLTIVVTVVLTLGVVYLFG